MNLIKNRFYRKANYHDPLSYNEQYDNAVCGREDSEISAILNKYIPNDVYVVDIGCGTGLGSLLINNTSRYLGIDKEAAFIEYCRKNREGSYLLKDGNLYINEVDKINPMFIFSIDYLSIKAIKQYIEKTDKVLVAIHYNKPFKSPSSVYSGKRWLSKIILCPTKKMIMKMLFRREGATTFKLLGEEYYYVTIIERK